MHTRLTALSLMLLAACQSTGQETPPVETSTTPTTLIEILEDYSQLAQVNITFDDSTYTLLSEVPVTTVGPEDADVFRVGPVPAKSLDDAAIQNVRFETVKLQHADAWATAEAIDAMVQDAAGGGEPSVKIMAHVETNSLLIMATEQTIDSVLELVKHLDVEKQES